MDLGLVSLFLLIVLGLLLFFRNIWTFVRALAIVLAIANDLLDMGIGSVPVASWLLDIIECILICLGFRSGWGLLSLLELVPSLNVLPINMLAALIASWRKRRT